VQQAALAALEATRAAGNEAGLVVLATGLGKTWLAAFDAGRPEFRRVLFVAHREEILTQALHTFRQIRPDARLGRFTGQEKTPDVDVLFASIQTLSRVRHLETFARDAFDYMVVDEFHHADAATYRRVIDYFTPQFLLGLTATPDRTDGGDLLALCGQNLVYGADLVEGIEAGLLCPFAYFGVPDEVDYRNIPWRSARFSEEELTAAVATQRRAQNAFEQWQRHSPRRTLGFCCSVRHADFMAEFFRERGVRALAVHSGPGSSSRAEALDALQRGELQVLFAVDMFNEGLDVPQLDAVLMLRPTESTIVWLQQFGRGLRQAEGKERLTVIDYIGNHRSFLIKAQALLEPLLGDVGTDAQLRRAFRLVQRGELALPPGCAVTYELAALDILQSLLRKGGGATAVEGFVRDFVERRGLRPTAVETYQAHYNPRAVRGAHGSWLGFLKDLGLLEPAEVACLESARTFLEQLEKTQFTRSYKALTLLAMLNLDALPGAADIGALTAEFVRLARRSAKSRADVSVSLDDTAAVERLLREYPLQKWSEGRGTGGVSYFAVEGDVFRSTLSVPAEQRATFQALVRELCDWRLAEYLARPSVASADDESSDGSLRILCKVMQSNGRPILKLPNRASEPRIPTDWVEFEANGESYRAKFAKLYVNVIRRADGSDENVLADIVRKWFGPSAGQPGTTFHVAFEHADTGWQLRPTF
jgi:superfamily II DNA or RNA helicase